MNRRMNRRTGKRRVAAMLLAMLLGLLPTAVLAEEQEPNDVHNHIWAPAWSTNDSHHWHDCDIPQCPEDENSQKMGYGPHVYASEESATCSTCGYSRKLNHNPKDQGDPDAPLNIYEDKVISFPGEFPCWVGLNITSYPITITATSKTTANLSNYTSYNGTLGKVESGSVVVTLYKEFLQSLPDGKYTMEAVFVDGSTESVGRIQFTIKNPDNSGGTTPRAPLTGDANSVQPFLTMAVLALSALLGVRMLKRKNFEKQ